MNNWNKQLKKQFKWAQTMNNIIQENKWQKGSADIR